jgi:hypothetical protein
LIFGSYPEVLTQSNRNAKFEVLREIGESYLMKDIIEIGQSRLCSLLAIKKPEDYSSGFDRLSAYDNRD